LIAVQEARMAEGIPTCLSDAFKQAIVVCHDWSGDKREPPAIGIVWDPNQEPDPQHPETLCGTVGNFTDEMPNEIVALLLRLPYNVCDSVATDRSYANGARCLREFIELKRAMYSRDR
jgi:hypothetical protein